MSSAVLDLPNPGEPSIIALMRTRSFFVYIVASPSRVLYVGVTGDIQRRISEHREKLVPGFTAKYNATRLVYFEEYDRADQAIIREKQLKRWARPKKVALIERANPKWRDLSAEQSRVRTAMLPAHRYRSVRPSSINSRASSVIPSAARFARSRGIPDPNRDGKKRSRDLSTPAAAASAQDDGGRVRSGLR
jgi:putative endonuclease